MTDRTFDLVAKALRDDAEFRAQVQANPKAAMADKGLDVPHADVRVVADTPDTRHFVLPPDPNAALADDTLASVSGGVSDYYRRMTQTAGMSGCYWQH